MRVFAQQEIQDTIAAVKKAALSFDHRFYTADKKLEGLLLRAAAIIETYHDQAQEQQQTAVMSDGLKLDAILENLQNMSSDITALNQAIVNLTTVYQAQHTAIAQMLEKNAASATPLDYSEQINSINGVIANITTDDASINSVLQPVGAATPVAGTAANSTDSASSSDTSSSSSTTSSSTEAPVADTSSSATTAS